MKHLIFALAFALPLTSTVAWSQDLSDQEKSAANAFKAFWASTDCAQMRKLSDWPQLVAKMHSNDKELCESLVSLHQFVQQVEVTGVQLLPGDKARVSANISMLTGTNIKQQDTFTLVDGKWLLSAQ